MKALFRTHDGHPVEAVLMRYRDGRRSICISAPVRMPPDVHVFCATGAMRFGRNLTASEIVDQALHFRRREQLNHAVYMGMGEPFLNVDEVLASARLLPTSASHIAERQSRRWAGCPLRRFVDDVDAPIRLALSVHAADPVKRSELMPVNDRYPLEDVLAECRRYVALRRRKVFVEYVMLAGVNDSSQGTHVRSLDSRPEGVQGEPHSVQPDGAVRRLLAAGDRVVQVRPRSRPDPGDGAACTRGRDIEAACGQLASAR